MRLRLSTMTSPDPSLIRRGECVVILSRALPLYKGEWEGVIVTDFSFLTKTRSVRGVGVRIWDDYWEGLLRRGRFAVVPYLREGERGGFGLDF